MSTETTTPQAPQMQRTPVPPDLPPPAVPQVPAAAAPPMPTVPPQVPAPAEPEPYPEDRWTTRLKGQVVAGAAVLRENAAAWLTAAEMDDPEQALAEVRVDRDRRTERAIEAHRRQTRELREQMTALVRAGDEHAAARLGKALEALAMVGPDAPADEITRRDVRVLRRRRRAERAGIAAAAAAVAVWLPLHVPALAPVEAVTAVGVVWAAGRDKEDQEQAVPAVAPVAGLASVPAPAAVAVPAGPEGDRAGELVSMIKPPAWSAGDGETPAAPAPDVPEFDAPPLPALSEETLVAALRQARIPGFGPDSVVKILAAPAWGEDGTATTVFDMPVTVGAVQRKLDDLAGALGRSRSMIDLAKAGAENRASLWLSDQDPFDAPRPSPLLKHTGGLDVWRDGVPVGYTRRGAIIALPLKDSSFVLAGMTRSGKGVGASNLLCGAALDVRVNLRIVAGKVNGEFDAYAKSGVAATYFKQNPQRLLALINALKADLNRRNAILGELSRGKISAETIMRLGGIEVLVIDELRTFTAKDKPARDEILDGLTELSAVAAGAGILLVLITQYPEVEVIPTGLAMNCGTRWAMRVDTAQQSNTILGGGAASAGRDASKFDPPVPGLGWLVNPFAEVIDLVRSFDLDEDDRGEVTAIMQQAAALRQDAGRLTGQWDDPIERALLQATGLSSAAGGPQGRGEPGRPDRGLSPEHAEAHQALAAAVEAADALGRDAQLDELAAQMGDGMTADRLGELLRRAGAGPTGKITVPGRGRVNGYARAHLRALLERA